MYELRFRGAYEIMGVKNLGEVLGYEAHICTALLYKDYDGFVKRNLIVGRF
jgi:hypothetical protein